jgi:hypothetical protein
MIKHIDIPKNVTENLRRLSSRAWYPNMNQRPKIIVLLALFVLMLRGWYSRGCCKQISNCPCIRSLFIMNHGNVLKINKVVAFRIYVKNICG